MIWLVVLTCFNHLEKYEFVNGKDAIPYMKWKIKFMFETTNQIQSVIIAWFTTGFISIATSLVYGMVIPSVNRDPGSVTTSETPRPTAPLLLGPELSQTLLPK